MHLYLASEHDTDVAAIERVLMRQDGVIDASVLERMGRIVANVTVRHDSHFHETDLMAVCDRELGSGHRPAMILLQRAMRPAA